MEGMGHNIGTVRIPAIDIEDFPAEFQRLREACEVWGCFRIVNHPIPLELMAQMKAVVAEFFGLPEEVKRRNRDVIAGSVYKAPSLKNPFHEAFGLYDMGDPDTLAAFCSSLDASPHQREVMEKYVKATRELVNDISDKLSESLGLSRGRFKAWPSQFWTNKYNFAPEAVGSPGIQIHTDLGFVTLLQDDENVGGLEVMDKSSSFVPVDPWHGTFIVNLGDVAKAWSNGKWQNVKHRVECKQPVVRFSIATTLCGPKEEPVEAPQELIDSEHPRLYVPFIYKDYRALCSSTNRHDGETLEQLRADYQPS